MVRYFDSSFILSLLFAEHAGGSMDELWRSPARCLASNLLLIECVIAIRRVARSQPRSSGEAAGERWARSRLAALDRILTDFDLKVVDRSIEEIIRSTPVLAECRTLDAIHLATALHFKPAVEGELEVVTLDRTMRSVARKLGLSVRPHA
jgi:predicted nucleic acid-binding protein